jgi:hypothetical protein
MDIPESSRVRYSAVLDVVNLWGKGWQDCICTFVKFERAAGFTAKDTHLPTLALRPPEIQTWFEIWRKMDGPQWDNKLCQGDFKALRESWWSWWGAIQPSGHRVDENQMPSKGSGNCDWNPICKPGSSGIFMVLLVLVWWRKRLDAGGKGGDKRWEDAVDDVTWVLEHLTKVNQHVISVAKVTNKRK